MSSPRLSSAAYLSHLRADAARLGEVATGHLTARVPSCPDWDVAGLVLHTATVYQHKIACMRLGRRPDEADWPKAAPDGDVVRWLGESLEALVHELVTRGPGGPAYTWFPPDQTVGFWYRRMAQETAVHRVDAELAAGAVTPIDEALASDGIDELLASFLGGDWSDEPVLAASGRSVGFRTGGHMWSVTLQPNEVVVRRDLDDVVATVSGEANDLLLWLWGGRVGDDAIAVEGDSGALNELRKRLDLVTS